jgi:hypothetical protein
MQHQNISTLDRSAHKLVVNVDFEPHAALLINQVEVINASLTKKPLFLLTAFVLGKLKAMYA